jgi:A/G-specific adenine glycosylase
MADREFREMVWQYWRENGRQGLPWREDPSPYNVVVSELMLQQTQVHRVVPKFNEFISLFPDFPVLAKAPLSEVLIAWQGLGYNRRAKYLHELAKAVVACGGLPDTQDELVKLPGIGKNTAGAILAYAFEQPVVYIETNIRTVYLHHYFADRFDVDDKELLPIVERTLDHDEPRAWYSALMDYGTFLKKQGLGRLDASKHYKKQSKFEGSVRQMRGAILRALASGPLTLDELKNLVNADERFGIVSEQLINENLITARSSGLSQVYRLSD